VEGGDMDEPIADAIRAIADGHIILSRELAAKNHFPAIDVLQSISRVMSKVATKEFRIVSSYLRNLMAAYKQNEDLINVGAYVAGSNPTVDKAMLVIDEINELLKQDLDLGQPLSQDELFDKLVGIARKAEGSIQNEDVEEESSEKILL
jgi:flagellum-specific ATP synthase